MMMKSIHVIVLSIILSHTIKAQSNTIDDHKTWRIAYNVLLPDSIPGGWEIFIMQADGSHVKNITRHADVAWTYTAYRDRLFFVSDRDTCYRCYFLYECDGEGLNVRKVSDLRLEDSFMSTRNQGTEIVVSGRTENARSQLFIINTSTGQFRQITHNNEARHYDPCFSPDGHEIVFSHKKNKADKTTHEELYLMDVKSGELTQLTQYPQDNPSAKEPGFRASAARWHPTEDFITYVSQQDGRNSIFAVTPDGKNQWKLLDSEHTEGWHDWSSDGKWLVYDGAEWPEHQNHIYLLNWKTKEKKQLTDTTYETQFCPVFLEK